MTAGALRTPSSWWPIVAEVRVPSGDIEWQAAMRERAVSMREVLAGDRWAIGLMESRSAPGPATLRHHDAFLAQFPAESIPTSPS